MSLRERELERITELYSKYLNGPLGQGVMGHLKEGESFTIRSQGEFVRVSKRNGKAIVRVIKDMDESEDIRSDLKDIEQSKRIC